MARPWTNTAADPDAGSVWDDYYTFRAWLEELMLEEAGPNPPYDHPDTPIGELQAVLDDPGNAMIGLYVSLCRYFDGKD